MARVRPVPQPVVTNVMPVCALAWVVPGAGHLWLGRRRTGVILIVALPLMFAVGLWLEGALFPFETGQALVTLAGLAEMGVGVPYLCALLLGLGDGRVVAVTFEYGNTFLVVAGLLNILVVLDVYDIAHGRK